MNTLSPVWASRRGRRPLRARVCSSPASRRNRGRAARPPPCRAGPRRCRGRSPCARRRSQLPTVSLRPRWAGMPGTGLSTTATSEGPVVSIGHDDRSRSAKVGWARMDWISVGHAATVVARSVLTMSSAASGSNLSRHSTVRAVVQRAAEHERSAHPAKRESRTAGAARHLGRGPGDRCERGGGAHDGVSSASTAAAGVADRRSRRRGGRVGSYPPATGVVEPLRTQVRRGFEEERPGAGLPGQAGDLPRRRRGRRFRGGTAAQAGCGRRRSAGPCAPRRAGTSC